MEESLNYIGMGIRKPGTEIGFWNGAYVLCWEKTTLISISALFENRMDYVSRRKQRSIAELIKMWTGIKNDYPHWEPMTAEDILKTAGLNVEIYSF